MSFDKFILAVESRDLSQADKGYRKTSQKVLKKRPNGVQPRPQDLGDRGRRLDRTNDVAVTRHMLGNRAMNNVGIHLAKVLLLFEFKS